MGLKDDLKLLTEKNFKDFSFKKGGDVLVFKCRLSKQQKFLEYLFYRDKTDVCDQFVDNLNNAPAFLFTVQYGLCLAAGKWEKKIAYDGEYTPFAGHKGMIGKKSFSFANYKNTPTFEQLKTPVETQRYDLSDCIHVPASELTEERDLHWWGRWARTWFFVFYLDRFERDWFGKSEREFVEALSYEAVTLNKILDAMPKRAIDGLDYSRMAIDFHIVESSVIPMLNGASVDELTAYIQGGEPWEWKEPHHFADIKKMPAKSD